MDACERLRQSTLLSFERQAWAQGFCCLAGIDEAGRGPLAGPVVAAACILPKEYIFAAGVNDSKKLSPKLRANLFDIITNDANITYGIGIIDHIMIDKVNILVATHLAMKAALNDLALLPDYLLVDGLQLAYQNLPSKKIIKGDQLSLSIATASIIAKETRDRIMLHYHKEWVHYGFDKHKGYGTKLHRDAIKKHGHCPIHRKSFEPVKSLLKEPRPILPLE